MIAEVTRTQPAEHWIEAFLAAGVPAGPVLDLGEVFAHPQVQALGIAQPVEHPNHDGAAVVGQPLTFGDGMGDPRERQRAGRRWGSMAPLAVRIDVGSPGCGAMRRGREPPKQLGACPTGIHNLLSMWETPSTTQAPAVGLGPHRRWGSMAPPG